MNDTRDIVLYRIETQLKARGNTLPATTCRRRENPSLFDLTCRGNKLYRNNKIVLVSGKQSKRIFQRLRY